MKLLYLFLIISFPLCKTLSNNNNTCQCTCHDNDLHLKQKGDNLSAYYHMIKENNKYILQIVNVNFHSCIHDWCFQKGTKEQYTRCKKASEDGRTCYYPTIRYGSTTGGRPAKHPKNDIAGWCQQLFPTSIYGGTATYNIKIERHMKSLFWCSLYDEISPHWCDFQDGTWKDSTLGYATGGSTGHGNVLMDSVTCLEKNSAVIHTSSGFKLFNHITLCIL